MKKLKLRGLVVKQYLAVAVLILVLAGSARAGSISGSVEHLQVPSEPPSSPPPPPSPPPSRPENEKILMKKQGRGEILEGLRSRTQSFSYSEEIGIWKPKGVPIDDIMDDIMPKPKINILKPKAMPIDMPTDIDVNTPYDFKDVFSVGFEGNEEAVF